MSETESHLALIAGRTDADEDGLFSFRVDATSGGLGRLDAIPAGDGPKFLAVAPDGDACYVVDTTDGGSVLAAEVDPGTGDLRPLNRVPSGDRGPCYCSVDGRGEYVLVAHYAGGSVSVLPIEGDRVGEPTDVVEHEGSGIDPDRQEAPHPHAIVPGPDDRFVYVPDLGTDRVYVYELDRDRGRLRPADPPHVAIHDGAGPRHLAFGPGGEFAYLVGELDSTLTTLERDPETGALSTVGTAGMLPEGFRGENKPADVHVHPSGRWVYASNRGHDSVVICEVDEAGRARPVAHESTRGSWPRDFAIDPGGRFLYAENQNTDEVVVFRIDGDAGRLGFTGETVDVPRPGCMAFVE